MNEALEILAGAVECGAEYDCPVVGGDTNSWDHPTVISITVAGRCPPDIQPVRRDGARVGDRLAVTGPLGGSILGRHLTFRPRITEGLRLARELHVHALIDISDGLALDLSRICEASGCGAVLEPGLLDAAIHADARLLASRDGRSPREHALEDGEDFELLAAIPGGVPDEQLHALGLLPLGRFAGETGIWLDAPEGRQPVTVRGWEHFK
jgi:thiamine-monophosphate kinase